MYVCGCVCVCVCVCVHSCKRKVVRKKAWMENRQLIIRANFILSDYYMSGAVLNNLFTISFNSPQAPRGGKGRL